MTTHSYLGLFCAVQVLFISCWSEGEFTEDSLPGCGFASCSDRLNIYLHNTDGKDFPEGQYSWELELSAGHLERARCDLSKVNGYSCDGSGVLSAMDQEKDGSFHLSMNSSPPRFRLSLQYNDIWIYGQSVAPDYYLVTPNGPDCDPICFQATTHLTLEVQETSNHKLKMGEFANTF